MQFVHLHVHSHFSILDGMSKIEDLVNKCVRLGMPAMALTDHGNMFGIKEFVDVAAKSNGKVKKAIKELEENLSKEGLTEDERQEIEKKIEEEKKHFFKPIIGVEAYCARRTLKDKDAKVKQFNPESGREQIVDYSGYHLVLLAKNKKGYQNLCKLVSTAWIDGLYGRPRIDKQLLEQYHEGLIVTSACLGGELSQLIIAKEYDKAIESINWFKRVFGDDFYIEVQYHKTNKSNADYSVYERQEQVMPQLIELAKKTNTKVVATNDVHFVEEFHSEAHDRLICLSTATKVDDANRLRYTKQEWLKSPEEMQKIFPENPEFLSNTLEIADKVESFSLNSDPIMPKFPIPEEFGTEEDYRKKFTEEQLFDEFTQDEKGNVVMSREKAEEKIKKLGGYDKLYRIKLEADYLNKLAWEGAQKRYGAVLSEDQKERIEFELYIMKTMGFPGYFLIVQDFIRAAREELGVSVGPGRGSAAGSVVAYCLGITDIDPLKYDLLFERFLNPDRISLPDIDVDFDDEGRGLVLDWVAEKYGKEKVAHIITYGTMATKSSIADVGRVQNVPLQEVNRIKSLIPDSFDDSLKDERGKLPKVNLANCLRYVPELNSLLYGEDQNISSMLEYARDLEGTVRQTGIHACGVIIGAEDLTNFAPLSTVKDRATEKYVLVTEYDGHVVEQVGLIKMDFLGLSTLSIIKETIRNIKKTKGINLDIDKIPIDDEATYKLYAEGKTIGTFQFESPGMQKYLKELQPTVFEDLIAMNALYRPGPMDYIPQFIRRKRGEEPIAYDIPIMERYLKDTYGVTVYQEQVMLLSRLLAGFTRGESDSLRKAMGKKIISVLDELKPKFIEGGRRNGHDLSALEKIWADWEKFAAYAFNKSHATCYSWVSYQTAYLKAHYPAEFMAANLTQSKDTITDVAKFMDECVNMGIGVLGPDVNESDLNFSVTKNGDIRFGLGGIKGVGEAAVESILKEREKNGNFKDIFDFVERVNLSSCNKKTMESLIYAGAFDSLDGCNREQYFIENEKGEWQLNDVIIRYGNRFQSSKNDSQASLFGDDIFVDIMRPSLPQNVQWSRIERLNKEREAITICLSSHPLDDYFVEIKKVTTHSLKDLPTEEELQKNPDKYQHLLNEKILVAGRVADVKEGTIRNGSRAGEPYGGIKLEDYDSSREFMFWRKDFTTYHAFLRKDCYLMIEGVVQDRRTKWNKWNKPQETKAEEIVPLEFSIKRVVFLHEVLSNVSAIKFVINVSEYDWGIYQELFNLVKGQKTTESYRSVRLDFEFLFNGIKISKYSKLSLYLTPEIKEFLRKNHKVLDYSFKFD